MRITNLRDSQHLWNLQLKPTVDEPIALGLDAKLAQDLCMQHVQGLSKIDNLLVVQFDVHLGGSVAKVNSLPTGCGSRRGHVYNLSNLHEKSPKKVKWCLLCYYTIRRMVVKLFLSIFS